MRNILVARQLRSLITQLYKILMARSLSGSEVGSCLRLALFLWFEQLYILTKRQMMSHRATQV